MRGLISIFFKKYVRIWSVGEGGSRKASVARLLQTRPGLSQPVRVTLSHASPFKGVAAATRREVGVASSPSSAPCLRIKVKEVNTDAEARMRMNLKRELVFKEDGQEYAQVIKMLGNGRLEAMCFSGVKRLCHIRGKLRKKVWINTSDVILVGLRDYQDNKADVILKYNADEARSLKVYGELPEHAKINETDTFGPGDDDEIQFDDIGDDDEDIDDI